MSDEQRMRDLDAENIMCRRVNAELREQIQGLFKERDAWKTAHQLLGKYADDCMFRTSELNDHLEMEADEAHRCAIRLEKGKS
jgi:hypothetical protein